MTSRPLHPTPPRLRTGTLRGVAARAVALLAAVGVLAAMPLPLEVRDLLRGQAVGLAACVESCAGSCPMHAGIATPARSTPRRTTAPPPPAAAGEFGCALRPGPQSLPPHARTWRMAWSLPSLPFHLAAGRGGLSPALRIETPAGRTPLPSHHPPRRLAS